MINSLILSCHITFSSPRPDSSQEGRNRWQRLQFDKVGLI